jgi:hypothetical protein
MSVELSPERKEAAEAARKRVLDHSGRIAVAIAPQLPAETVDEAPEVTGQ